MAAPFGWIDWFAIPAGTRAKRIGLMHAIANISGMLIFAVSVWLRWHEPEKPSSLAIGLSLVGLVGGMLGGWLGGELVSRLSVGVHEGAHLNAPHSLSGRGADDGAKS